LLTP